MNERRTRIVCTVGPASASALVLTRMFKVGMSAARLNFSYGSHSDHRALIRLIRSVSKKLHLNPPIIQDLQGLKLRVESVSAAAKKLSRGQRVVFGATAQKTIDLVVDSSIFFANIKAGERLFIHDGEIEIKIDHVSKLHVEGTVIVGGEVLPGFGLNLPDTVIPPKFTITAKDLADLEFGVKEGVDWVCLSFVDDAKAIKEVKAAAIRFAKKYGTPAPLIMAKIERHRALHNFEAILDVADGIMLGRGDLGIEVPPEDVPIIQKEVAERCRLSGKPLIIATHLLESMREHPRATRAEISDVANAVFDLVDAVMLSAESATGQYPAAAVQSMAKVIDSAERSRYDDFNPSSQSPDSVASLIDQTLAVASKIGKIKAIVARYSDLYLLPTLNSFRPSVPVAIITPDQSSARKISLRAGFIPIVTMGKVDSFIQSESQLKKLLKLKSGDTIALLSTARAAGFSLGFQNVS